VYDPVNDWGRYSAVGIQMVITVLICWWLGLKAGEHFQVEPWGSLVGILFGLFVGTYNLIKSIT